MTQEVTIVCDGCGKRQLDSEKIHEADSRFAGWRMMGAKIDAFPFRRGPVAKSVTTEFTHTKFPLHACSPTCFSIALQEALEEAIVAANKEDSELSA